MPVPDAFTRPNGSNISLMTIPRVQALLLPSLFVVGAHDFGFLLISRRPPRHERFPPVVTRHEESPCPPPPKKPRKWASAIQSVQTGRRHRLLQRRISWFFSNLKKWELLKTT